MSEATFHILTFGCQMNANDSVWLARALERQGLTEAADEADADVFVVNTCSVREKPELKVYSLLGRLKQYYEANPRVFVAVGGCVAQQVGKEFWKRYPFVRLVFGADGVAEAPQAIARLVREPGIRLSLLDFTEDFEDRDPALPDAPDADGAAAGGLTGAVGHQAFVTIMQGCDNYCAYCIVPYVRGRQKSRPSESILAECRALVERGVRELCLLGQNVNSYGLDAGGDGTGFAQLLRRVAGECGPLGLERLRFTTSHPKDLADEVIDAFGELDILCPQLHLPLQSGSDRILKAMGRKYDLRRYFGLVDRLRAARPDIALSTDLIVGFPGETEEDFQQTLDAMEQVRYASSFSFRYSDRPGVRAETMPFKVEDAVKAERLDRLQRLQERFTMEHLASMVGKRIAVLVEGESLKQGKAFPSWRGHDPYGFTVNALLPDDLPGMGAGAAGDLRGRMVSVEVTEAKKHSLFGTIAGTAW